MAPQVKFTSFGIPFIVEFANVTFRRTKRKSAVPPPLPPKDHAPRVSHRRISIDSDWTFASTASSATLYPTVDHHQSEGQALYIRFASEGLNAPMPGPLLSQQRLEQLKRRLRRAVLAAGMDPSPGTVSKDGKVSPADEPRARIKSTGTGALYRGTYGQVEQAIREAGLSARRCDESLPNGR